LLPPFLLRWHEWLIIGFVSFYILCTGGKTRTLHRFPGYSYYLN
jgi:hypothetical protein